MGSNLPFHFSWVIAQKEEFLKSYNWTTVISFDIVTSRGRFASLRVNLHSNAIN